MSNFPPIIGLNGVARAGKDTVAKILADLYMYEVYSFSETLNDALVALNPIVGVVYDRVKPTEYRYADLVKEHGYEKAKETEEVRRLLQAMGTEVGRNLLGANIWVEALAAKINKSDKPAVITNVRFPNEAEMVWSKGGVVWEVTRPGFKPALGHVSDTALDAIRKDAYLVNDGTVTDLSNKVIDLMYILEKRRVDRPVMA